MALSMGEPSVESVWRHAQGSRQSLRESIAIRRIQASMGMHQRSEKFKTARPSFTSRCTSHEAGAMLAYAGHSVSLLWQSKHACYASARV
jgi:hypothetical protein